MTILCRLSSFELDCHKINRYLESLVVREMDKRDDQEPFIPLAGAGSFMNPVNQPPPSMPPPPYETYDSISTPTAPYPTDFNTNETLLNDSEQNDKNVQNKGFIKIRILFSSEIRDTSLGTEFYWIKTKVL